MKFKCNHVVAIGFKVRHDNTAAGVDKLSKKVIKDTTNRELEEVVRIGVQDVASKALVRLIIVEEETCDMHDTDKVEQSAIGDLMRSKNKVAINSFLENLDLLKKLRNQAKWFESSSTYLNDYSNML